MNSTLGISAAVPNSNVAALTAQQQTAAASRVKTMGIIALVLLPTGFIPILGFFGLIASLIISRRALQIWRDNLLPLGIENPAHWASTISTVLLILSVNQRQQRRRFINKVIFTKQKFNHLET